MSLEGRDCCPGEMGAAIGKCLTDRGYTVLWASQGRRPATAARAAAAGLTDAGTVAEVAARAEVILSVCPPHAALEVARSVAGFSGLFVDANAIAPQTTRSVAAVLGAARFVDGGIIGPPPAPGRIRQRGTGRGCTWRASRRTRSRRCSPARPSARGSWTAASGRRRP